jgi:DNA-binding transcriptional MerR regulator
MYRRKDVELLLQIKHLLYEKKFTIEGARQFLQGASKATPKAQAVQTQGALFGNDALPEIRKELASILELLSNDKKRS